MTQIPYKIYYVANARMPTERAHGIQLAKMCEAFQKQGVLVELMVPARKTVPIAPQDFYGLGEKIVIKRLPVLDSYLWGRWGFRLGSFSFTVSYFSYLFYKRFFRKETAVIYTTDLDQFSFWAIPFIGMPYFIEMHDAKPKSFIFAFLFRRSNGIIAINTFIKKRLVEIFGVFPDRILVFPNGVDISAFHIDISKEDARHKLGITSDKPIALYAGHCYPWKGLSVLTEAAALAGDQLNFYLVGGTEEELRGRCGIREVPSNLFCAGLRPWSEIPLWLAAADLLLVLGTAANAYSYYYTSPMKFFEYLAARKPIVASATPANREIASEEEVVFYEPDNAADLAAKIGLALSNGNTAADLYQKAESFSWDRRAHSIIAFMEAFL